MAGIYIHIPFCKKACHYCNFHFSTQVKHLDAFVKALITEISLRKDYLQDPIQTLYFGGGTPSLLSPEHLRLIVNQLKVHCTLTTNLEFTLEANPDDINPENLVFWKSIGVNRLSIGIQSFQNEALEWMNRAHQVSQSHQAIKLAQDAGFSNISVDLIYGTPHYTKEHLLADLKIIEAYQIPHVSCYALTVEEKTALHSMIQKGQMKNVVTDEQAEHFEMIVDYLSAIGFEHYEISNFAKSGNRSQHNSSYWKSIPYIGFGPSAHSYNGDSRQWNIANNALYIQSLEQGNLHFDKEILDLATQYNEYMMISLRCIEGFHLDTIEQKFGKDYLLHTKHIIDLLDNQGVLEITKDGCSLKKSAKFLADGIASEFFIVGSAQSL
jgi:oxygen-independent coproporphyrinogen-3 oxidase